MFKSVNKSKLIATLSVLYLCFASSCSDNQIETYQLTDLNKEYRSPVGFSYNMNPVMRVLDGRLSNQDTSIAIKKFPDGVIQSLEDLSYAFLQFNGNSSAEFSGQVTILIKDVEKSISEIYIDRNGNLDFTDDGPSVTFQDSLLIDLSNYSNQKNTFFYELNRSTIASKNRLNLMNKYSPLFPKSDLMPVQNWIQSRRLNLQLSVKSFKDSVISILAYDKSLDGIFTFETSRFGDRIFISEGDITNKEMFLTEIQQGEPIDHNAVFKLYGDNYFIKYFSLYGDTLTLSPTQKETRMVYADGADISGLKIDLIGIEDKTINQLLPDDRPLLIDVGATWCGGCIAQEPIIKELYSNGWIEVVGLFAFDTEASVDSYVKRKQIKWPVGLVDPEFQDKFRLQSYPTYILLDQDGKIDFMVRTAEELKLYLSLKNQ